MDNTPAHEKRLGKTELLAQIHQSRADLENTLRGLSEQQLTAPGPEGWSIKDHLAHLAVWELGIAELLRRRDRFAAMGIKEAIEQDKDQDEINDLIYRRHAGLSLAQVNELFQSAHRQLLEAIEALSDEDLYRPYGYYVPGSADPRPDPVINWIEGNSSGHFAEHKQFIQPMLRPTG